MPTSAGRHRRPGVGENRLVEVQQRGIDQVEDGVRIDPERVQTNIVIFDVSGTGLAADEICARVRATHGVLCSGFGTSIRMVTHYDVSRRDVEVALGGLKAVVSRQ